MQMALDSQINVEDSKAILTGLLAGVGASIEHSSSSLADLQKQVSVPGGTTVEAIKVFDQHELKQIITDALVAVAKKSKDMAS